MTPTKHLALISAALLACLTTIACAKDETSAKNPEEGCMTAPKVQIDPDHLIEKATAARTDGRIGEALKILGTGLDAGAADPRFPFELGLCHLAMGEEFAADPESGGDPAAAFHDAQSYFEKTLELDPAHGEAERLAARCLYLNNDLDAARARIEAHLARQPDDAAACLLAGRILVAAFAASTGDAAPLLETAEAHLNRAISLEPEAEAAYICLGDCRIYAGNTEGALAAFQKGIGACRAAMTLHQRFLGTFAGSDVLTYKGATDFYKTLLERMGIEPAEQGLLWWYLAEWFEKWGTAEYSKGGQYAEAAALYGECAAAFKACGLAFGPYKPDATVRAAMAFCSEGWAHYNLSAFEQSEARFHEALNLYPGLDTAVKGLDYLGTAIVNTLGVEAACDFFKRAAEATPDIPKYWNNYAFFAREVARHEDAFNAYTKAVELSPDDTRYINDCGMMLFYYLKRDPEQSEKLFRRAWKTGDKKLENPFISEEDRAYHFEAQCDAILNLGRLLLVQDRVDECEPLVTLLLDKAPRRMDVQELKHGYENAKKGTPYTLPE